MGSRHRRWDNVLSSRGRVSNDPNLGPAASRDVLNDEQHEVLFAVADHNVLGSVRRRLAGPACLARRSLALETRSGCRHPVAEALAGVGKISVPAERS